MQSSQVFLCVAVGKKAVQAPRATTPRRRLTPRRRPLRRSSASPPWSARSASGWAAGTPRSGSSHAHMIQGGIRIALDGTLISRPRIVDQQRLTADPVFRAYAEEHNVNTTSCKAGLLQSPSRARALDLPAQRSVSATTPGHPGLAPVAAPICAAIPEENTMTIKSLKEEVGIARREGDQPQELKGDSSEAAGDHEARSSRRPSQCPGRRDHRRTL